MMNASPRLIAFALVASTSLFAACGDNTMLNNTANHAENNASADPDAGDNNDSGDDADADDSPDADLPPGCDRSGFELPANLEIVEENTHDDWAIYANPGDDHFELSITRESSIDAVGTYLFSNIPPFEGDATLLLGSGCVEGECATYYNAVAGTLDVTSFDKVEGGEFSATLMDLKLIELDANDIAVVGGETWCIDALSVRATVVPELDFSSPTCDTDGFTPAADTSTAVLSDGFLEVVAATSATFPKDELVMELYDIPADASAVGTYEFNTYDYASCFECLLIYRYDATGALIETYSAGAGTLEISNFGGVGAQFTATLSGAELVEVEIDEFIFDTTIVEDGAGYCIDAMNFDLVVEAAPTE